MCLKLLPLVALMTGGFAGLASPTVGYSLDISRNKVPTMESLFRIVDILAELRYNQFQLYTENAFAYSGHEDAWGDSSPMTAEEIRALDAYCAKKGIELVPNQNSFGHLEKWFRRPRYRHLAEAPQGGVKTPWGEAMAVPRALCPTDPVAVAFVDSLYRELLPNFRSKLLNVGCDEVWELESAGMGRSWPEVKARTRQQVWIDYFRKIEALARKYGRTAMFWDDMIVRRHPELIDSIPKEAIALEWGYEIKSGIDKDIWERDCRRLSEHGRRFYVCPGTSGFNALTGRFFNMKTNVNEAVAAGLKYGAEGYLMCDWGDGGMCQPWLTALPGLVYMRAKVDGQMLSDAEIAAAIDRLTDCKCGEALIRYQNLYRLSGNPTPFCDNTLFQLLATCNRNQKGMTDETIAAVRAEHAAAKARLDLTNAPGWVRDGFATMDVLLEAVYLRWQGEHARVVRESPTRFRQLWLRYNRPGGLDATVKTIFHPPRVCELVVAVEQAESASASDADRLRRLTEACLAEGVPPHLSDGSGLSPALAQRCFVGCRTPEGLTDERVSGSIDRERLVAKDRIRLVLRSDAVSAETARQVLREAWSDPRFSFVSLMEIAARGIK